MEIEDFCFARFVEVVQTRPHLGRLVGMETGIVSGNGDDNADHPRSPDEHRRNEDFEMITDIFPFLRYLLLLRPWSFFRGICCLLRICRRSMPEREDQTQ